MSGSIPLQKKLAEFAQQRRDAHILRGDKIRESIQFTSLFDILPRTPHPALIPPCKGEESGINILSHSRLVEFIENEFNLKRFGLNTGDRVGVCLPQGAELVVCILATVSYCACVPINPSITGDEIKFELHNVQAKAVIYTEEDSAHIMKAALELGITSIILRPKNGNGGRSHLKSSGHIESDCGLFSLRYGITPPNATRTLQKSRSFCEGILAPEAAQRLKRTSSFSDLSPNKQLRLSPLNPKDVALILHTSGIH